MPTVSSLPIEDARAHVRVIQGSTQTLDDLHALLIAKIESRASRDDLARLVRATALVAHEVLDGIRDMAAGALRELDDLTDRGQAAGAHRKD